MRYHYGSLRLVVRFQNRHRCEFSLKDLLFSFFFIFLVSFQESLCFLAIHDMYLSTDT